MESRLELIFKNQEDRKSKISMDEPRSDLTEGEIQTVMNDIITKNIFDTTGGELVAISSARIVTTEVQEFQV